jgi:hypothetical protein
MSSPSIAQDKNKLVVFGSQLVGVIIVLSGLLNQRTELHSPRPPGTQVSAAPDSSGNRFARLWEDPLEDLRTFERVAQPTPSPSLQAGVSPSPSDIPAEGPGTEPNDTPVKNREPRKLTPDKKKIASSKGARSRPASRAVVTSPSIVPVEVSSPSPTPRTKDLSTPSTVKAAAAEQNQARPLQIVPASSMSPRPTGSGVAASTLPPRIKYKFLWNILDARPIPDETERRLRIRYAVVSAVEALGYLPYRESVLVPINLDTAKDTTNKPSPRLIGYFETFYATDAKFMFQRVCLIWTPKQYDINGEIIKTVIDQIGKLDEVTPEQSVHILHYGTSDDLDYYLQKHKGLSSEPIISFMDATMPVSPTPPPLLRPIVTDDVLVGRLADELKLRIPALNLPYSDPADKPRIVIFTESNTKYSRAITRELANQLQNTRQEVYTYLRGLDGRSDDLRSTVAPGNSKRDGASSVLEGNAISETSFGTSQFDYLRRIALSLEGKKSRDRKNRVVAVGILGSDIYDKILVLQAIRSELPSAIFFTTDLDTLYLHQEMEPFTRNLVVASADGLDPNDPADKGANWKLPPMRDSYQSVLVKEVRTILTSAHPNTNSIENAKRSRIYEIAPGKSIELDPKNQSTVELRTSLSALQTLATGWLNVVIFSVALANAIFILWAIFKRLTEGKTRSALIKRHAAKVVIVVQIGVTSLGLFFLLYKLSWSHAHLLLGEPLALGISIWPSIMIRLLAFIVAILLLLIASHSFVVYGTEEKEKLEKALPKDLIFSSRSFWNKTPKTTSLHVLLEKLISPKARIWRIVIASVLYLIFSFALFWIWPPTTPGRGAWPLLIEKIVLAFGVALYIIHLVFCIDLHWSALQLLRALATHYAPGVPRPLATETNSPAVLAALSTLTNVIGRTLLYPLTILILIILSRLRLFDNWRMTPSLAITFALGAILLVAASLTLWGEGARLKRSVLRQNKDRSRTTEQLQNITVGVFAPWYNQPIFSAILSAAAVFGSLTAAGPLTRLLFG